MIAAAAGAKGVAAMPGELLPLLPHRYIMSPTPSSPAYTDTMLEFGCFYII
jgi:hypothetical protein